MNTFLNYTLDDFVRAVSDRTPTPGGGSVAALGSLLGCSLGLMALRYSESEQTAPAVAGLEQLQSELALYVDRDARAYETFQTALKLPKGTPEEKEKRTRALQEALLGAAEVPFQTMRLSMRGLDILGESAGICNKNLVSDMESGILFLETGLKAAASNVMINAASLKDPKRKEELVRECGHLLQMAEARRSAALSILKPS